MRFGCYGERKVSWIYAWLEIVGTKTPIMREKRREVMNWQTLTWNPCETKFQKRTLMRT